MEIAEVEIAEVELGEGTRSAEGEFITRYVETKMMK